MHIHDAAPCAFGNHPSATEPCCGDYFIDAARTRKKILLTLHRYLERDIPREVCLHEISHLRSAMTVEERHILDASDDHVCEELRGRGQLWLESAATIMWGLGELDSLPPFDSTSYLYKLPTAQSDPCPKSTADLTMARRIAALWTTRALLWATLKMKPAAPQEHVPTLVLPVGMEGVIELMDGDLVVMKTFPISELTGDDCAFIAAISNSRLHALNWLLAGKASPFPAWNDPGLNDYIECEVRHDI